MAIRPQGSHQNSEIHVKRGGASESEINSAELIIRTLNSDLCSSRPEIYLGERISHASVLQEHQKLVKFSQKPLGYADSERRDTHNGSFYVPLAQRRSVRRCRRTMATLMLRVVGKQSWRWWERLQNNTRHMLTASRDTLEMIVQSRFHSERRMDLLVMHRMFRQYSGYFEMISISH